MPFASLNHPVRPRQHIRRYGQADLLSRFQIDHQLELRGSLHRHIGRLGSLQDSVHVGGDASVAVREVRPLVHEPTSIYSCSVVVKLLCYSTKRIGSLLWQPVNPRLAQDAGEVFGFLLVFQENHLCAGQLFDLPCDFRVWIEHDAQRVPPAAMPASCRDVDGVVLVALHSPESNPAGKQISRQISS